MTQLIFASNPVVAIFVLLAILLLAVEVPYQLGRRSVRLRAIDRDAFNTIQAGLLTLVAFMLGLTFAQAQGRFDARRALVVTEANAIGTTWLRSDQLTPPETARLRQTLVQYTRQRVEAYSTPGETDLHARAVRDSDHQQAQMWALVSTSLRERPGDLGRSLLMTTLNDTIDISAEQLSALTHHVPTSVIVMTLLLVLLGLMSIGLGFARDKSRPLMLTLLYVFAFTIVLNLIIDYDRPRVGFVHVSLDPLRLQLQSMER